jgi:rhodanese-related sulfurtransferase
MIYAPRFAKLVEDAKRQVREVGVADVALKIATSVPAGRGSASGYLLIDTREDHEFAKGHLPGAIHLGRGILERDIEALALVADRELILYCGGGGRSALAAVSLGVMGFTNVVSMSGGYRGWLDAGNAVACSAVAAAH